ncbi:hypothetical protein KI387_002902, partial [Taxus chinensis]
HKNGDPVEAWKISLQLHGNEVLPGQNEDSNGHEGQHCMAPSDDDVENTMNVCSVVNTYLNEETSSEIKDQGIDQSDKQESFMGSENRPGNEKENPDSEELESSIEFVFDEENSSTIELLIYENSSLGQSFDSFPASDGSAQADILHMQMRLPEYNETQPETCILTEDKDLHPEIHGLLEDKEMHTETKCFPEDREIQRETQRLPEAKEIQTETQMLPEDKETQPETQRLPERKETQPETQRLPERKETQPETHKFTEDKETLPETHRFPEDKETLPETRRLSRVTPVGLDEFKRESSNEMDRATINQLVVITHRLEPGDGEYNYVAASKGAKILAHNKEAKGVQNILHKDKNKYLRNPCSAEEKFVVIELSEESMVDTIVIADFEHYSSKLKKFELLSSLVYPTDDWVLLGNFVAENVKHSKRFTLQEPKWARYLKLQFLSHYGTEFYCTLSKVEVYGGDAIEHMLEDLISVGDHSLRTGELSADQPSTAPPPVQEDKSTDRNDELHLLFYGKEPARTSLEKETEFNAKSDTPKLKDESFKVNSAEPKIEIIQQHGGRTGGDTVLKILMQKVRSLELNLSVLERYLEELNSRYGDLFSDFDKELDENTELIRQILTELNDLQRHQKMMEKEMQEYRSWRSTISSELNELAAENKFL